MSISAAHGRSVPTSGHWSRTPSWPGSNPAWPCRSRRTTPSPATSCWRSISTRSTPGARRARAVRGRARRSEAARGRAPGRHLRRPGRRACAYHRRVTTPPSADTDPARLARPFPADFAWGFAASAYQIEGAAAEDGRGPSIWDTFARQPGAIADGSTGDVACDHYHRYPEDVRLMAELGARGVSLQHQLVARPARRGPAPSTSPASTSTSASSTPCSPRASSRWSTCSTGTCPRRCRTAAASPTRRSWAGSPTTPRCSRRTLGDRVKDWMTFNEPAVFAFLGHADGIHAPGLRDWPTAIRVADNELRAHAAAAQAIRAQVDGREDRHGDRRQPGRAGDRFGAGSTSPPTSGAPLATRGSSIRSSAVATRRWDSRLTARRATSTASTSPSRRPAISTTWA